MNKLVDLFCEYFDSPILQHISGFVLGIMFMGCMWLIYSAYESDKRIAELEAELEAEDNNEGI